MAFRDADQSRRCQATIRLSDGSLAQCGRAYDEGYRGNPEWRMFCHQHQKMVFKGTYRGDKYHLDTKPED
jgi:hypothetical protein